MECTDIKYPIEIQGKLGGKIREDCCEIKSWYVSRPVIDLLFIL